MATIEKLVYGGDGLARTDGKVEFIPYSIPGEEWTDGTLTLPSPERIDARCPYFARCGGCHYQHMPYERQLAAKKSILEETLARLGKIVSPGIDIVSGEPWEYRNRVQLHFDRGQFGFHAAGSKKLVAINECPISSPGIIRALDTLREMRRDKRFPRFLQTVELFTNENETLVNVLETAKPVNRRFFEWCAEGIPGALDSALTYPTSAGSFRVSHKSFFQVNRFLIDRLIELALESAEGTSALDLYAGVGLFSRPLSERFEKVTAVEVVRSATSDLAVNSPKTRIVQQSVEDHLAAAANDSPDFVLADPPRSGLGKRVVESLLRLKPSKLTIVSCDPATLARDLAALAAGGYAIGKMTLIDLFPQTFHIETVTHLTRN